MGDFLRPRHSTKTGTAMEGYLTDRSENVDTFQEIRAQEHAVFVQAKKDHDEVIGAIQIALKALGGQYALIQLGHAHLHRDRQPFEAGGDMPFSDYSSGSGGAASAMEMLEDLEGRYSAALSEIVSDENNAQKMHEEAIESLEALKPQCVDAAESYAERKEARQQEIKALKEALRMLEEWKGF